MHSVNVLEAKTNFSRLLESIELGREKEIVIARHGRPVARMVPFVRQQAERRIGVARGKFTVPDDIDVDNSLVFALLNGGGDAPAP